MRIALANISPPASREQSVESVLKNMKEAKQEGAELICFPECFLPVYRTANTVIPIDQPWLDQTWASIDSLAGDLGITVILGTERLDDEQLFITARVTGPDGTCLGFQDKVQLDPSEEAIYTAGESRKIFKCGDTSFGVVICHEGWRYPETTRWAAREGAQIVFHPHFEIVEDPSFRPECFADPCNSFHEKAALARAAENHIYFATVNCALEGATTTSAVIDPEGHLMIYQPYGKEGLLIADIDADQGDGFLAKRFKPEGVGLG